MHDALKDHDFSSPNIKMFFISAAFGVVGASANRDKFGNKVLRCYQHYHLPVYPVNPNEKEIEGMLCLRRVADLPKEVKSISIITPPAITEDIVDQAIAQGIQHVWMQPGAESVEAVRKCKENHINVIADGSCILRELKFRTAS